MYPQLENSFEEDIMRGWNHLTLKYFNTILVDYTCDAPKHIFPITLVVMESENNDSWAWFLIHLQDEIVDIE